jgi:hypothetical protein
MSTGLAGGLRFRCPSFSSAGPAGCRSGRNGTVTLGTGLYSILRSCSCCNASGLDLLLILLLLDSLVDIRCLPSRLRSSVVTFLQVKLSCYCYPFYQTRRYNISLSHSRLRPHFKVRILSFKDLS